MAPVPGTESYVIGGCGFVGRHIVERLLLRGETKVAVFDIVQRHFDDNVSFFVGDITKQEDLEQALTKSEATVVIHTASPIHGMGAAIYKKVNVDGTRTVLKAMNKLGVKKLVFTSSAGVVYDGEEQLMDVDERLTFPEVPMDAYNESKAEAEAMVLGANGKDGLKTCALRPAGIFGPGDRQVIQGLISVVTNKQTMFQIGNNDNLFDWTHVYNVAHAHLLAADKLNEEVKMEAFDDALLVPSLSTKPTKIPTSQVRPVGPVEKPTAEALEKAELYKKYGGEDANRPVLRTKFDQFAAPALSPGEPSPPTSLTVAGQAFFITNCEPVYFWDFPRAVWREVGHTPPYILTLPRPVGLVLARAAEVYAKLVGKEPGFTVFRVKFSTQARYYNTERARRLLGYEPIIGVQEGVKMTMNWWKEKEAAAASEKSTSTEKA